MNGRILGVWNWEPNDRAHGVVSVSFGDPGAPLVSVTTRDGTTSHHSRADHGWHIDLVTPGARSSIDLEGMVSPETPEEESNRDAEVADDEITDVARQAGMFADYDVPWSDESALPDPIESDPGGMIDDALMLPLGSAHYLRTEPTWSEAGEPTAMLQLARTDRQLIVDVDVATGPVVAPEPAADGTMENPLDNELADVNADGLQWYIGRPDSGRWAAAGLVVPVAAGGDTSELRMHRLTGDGSIEPACSWTTTGDGWAIRLVWDLEALPADDDGCIAFDLVINERPPERELRRGQLVLSGGDGFAYLRGDRQDPARALVIAVT